jgi:hypothetical protein
MPQRIRHRLPRQLLTGAQRQDGSSSGTKKGVASESAQQGQQRSPRRIHFPQSSEDSEKRGVGVENVKFGQALRAEFSSRNGALREHIVLDDCGKISAARAGIRDGRKERHQFVQHDGATGVRAFTSRAEAEIFWKITAGHASLFTRFLVSVNSAGKFAGENNSFLENGLRCCI